MSTAHANHQTNAYGFGYDKFGRLSSTDYYSGAALTSTAAFTERNISYDKNGNIQTLQRYAQNTASPADSYTYSYEGNALASISGTDNNASISGVQYSYDANGNMIHDGLKNLELSYNLLNLPSVVNQSSTEVATYSWFADGSKYSVLDNSNNGYYYIGSLIYASNGGMLQLESTAFAGGRINLARNTGGTLTQDIHYHHTDHLGSVRAITNQSGETVEQNAYYPFGNRHTFGNTYAQTTNRFKYNGKEEQTTGNLQYLDYGARMYDSKVARWFVQDPLSEKYYAHSPYNYCVNNPVIFVDPDGLEWFYYREKDDNEAAWHWRNESTYNTGVKDENGKEIILPGHNAVVVFNGSMNERLGEGDNLFGAGAVLADVIVYGPKGADDIGYYKGFTMSSDRDRYGVIDNGFYNVTRITDERSYGPYHTPFAINNKGNVPALNNYNPAFPNRNPAYLNYVYIHRANNNGWAGWKYDNQGIERAVSKGCLLIAPSKYNQNGTIKSVGWDQFSKQLQSVNKFLLHICR